MESSLKERLWHKMRADLIRYIPQIADTELLMCCACGRFLPITDFSLEHIIPQQSVADDPAEVKLQVATSERSRLTLLCRKRLVLKGEKFHGNGCNGYKGTYYDGRMRDVFNRNIFKKRFDTRHTTSVFAGACLAMVAECGYQVALTRSGMICREQFFSPGGFHKNMPIRCQLLLLGDTPSNYGTDLDLWRKPFIFDIELDVCRIIVRGVSLTLPISRDPRTPIASQIAFAPSKYILRPDFGTLFH